MAIDLKKVQYTDGETVIYAKNLNEIQDAILDLDRRTSEDNPRVFVAIYGTTSFADIQTAYADGKEIFARGNDTEYVLSSVEKQGTTFTAFSFSVFKVVDGTKYLYTCKCDANGWSNDVQQIELSEELLEPVEQTIKPTTVGPAAIATFEASAADMPLKGLTVEIEPVQDLHGYDHPWPVGGGKNLAHPLKAGSSRGLVLTENADGTMTLSGRYTGTANSTIGNSEPFTLPAGDYYINGGVSNTYRYQIVRASDISNLAASGGSQNVGFSLSEETECVCRIFISYAENMPAPDSNSVFRPMVRLASETDATFEPYSNICPITGWTGCNVTRTGKNLAEPGHAWNVNASGVVESNTLYETIVAHVKKGKTYTLSTNGVLAAAVPVAAFYSAYPSIGSASYNNTRIVSGGNPFTAPIDGYVVIRFPSGTAVIQVELGSTATAYEPYQGTTYPITFPSPDPGTVYGGTLDVVNRKLTSEKQMFTFNGGEADITVHGTIPNWFYIRFPALQYPNIYIEDSLSNFAISNQFIQRRYADINYNALPTQNEFAVGLTGGYLRFIFRPVSISTLEDFKAALNTTPVQVLCNLINGASFDIVAPDITTLLGTNNIWADCGDVSVTYGAYLETVKKHAEVVGDSILSAIAPLEATYTASRAYTVGSYLFVGTKFYKVTAAIGSGDTINPGTNVTQTTVAAQLMELAGN